MGHVKCTETDSS